MASQKAAALLIGITHAVPSTECTYSFVMCVSGSRFGLQVRFCWSGTHISKLVQPFPAQTTMPQCDATWALTISAWAFCFYLGPQRISCSARGCLHACNLSASDACFSAKHATQMVSHGGLPLPSSIVFCSCCLARLSTRMYKQFAEGRQMLSLMQLL